MSALIGALRAPLGQPLRKPVGRRLSAALGQAIASLFRANEQGVWYDPSDLSTMYQDSAGATAAVVNQPVGLMLDKRFGLARGPELATNGEFNTNLSGWVDASTAPATVAWDEGKARLTRIDDNNARLTQSFPTVAGKTYAVTVDIGDTTGMVLIGSTAGGTDLLPTTSIAPGARQVMFTAIGATAYVRFITLAVQTFTVDNVSCREIFGNHATQATTSLKPILRQSGALYYLEFDGVDDGMVTSAINFTATDKVTVWAGVRKLSDAAPASVVELGTVGTGTGGSTFGILAPASAGATYSGRSNGTVIPAATSASPYSSPVTNVLTLLTEIATDTALLRIDGIQKSTTIGDQGTGTYQNGALYIGRRGGTSLPFNGRLYGLTIRGAASTAAQIASVETYLATKTGVTL